MSALPIDRVWMGFWVDQAFNSPLGATITVRTNVANLVIAVLTVVVTIGGAAWWELSSFLLFVLSYRHAEHQPATIQKALILLRNVVSPGSFLLDALRLLYHNRRSARAVLAYLAGLLCVAVISSSGFVVAGIFASSVVSTDNINVLANSSQCGHMTSYFDQDDSGLILRQQFDSAWQYSQTCFKEVIPSLPQCKIFAGKSSPVPQQVEAPHPFPDMKIKNDTSFTLDSGLISSREHLGINSKKEDEVSIRMTKSCSVLSGDDYLTTVNSSDFDWSLYPNDKPTYEQPLYMWRFGPENTARGKRYNTSVFKLASQLNAQRPFHLSSLAWITMGNGSTAPEFDEWEPMPELRVESADIVLMQIAAAGMLYTHPVDDPLFAAHRPLSTNLSESHGQMLVSDYRPDSVSGWIACQEKYQYCFESRGCSRLHGLDVAFADADALDKTPVQEALMNSLTDRMYTFNLLAMFTPQVLVAFKLQQDGLSDGLPPDQWKTELTAWFNVVLTMLQAGASYYAMGDDVGFQGLNYTLAPPETEAAAAVCHMQKMKAPIGISNISVLGLGLTLGVSGFLFFLNLLLIPILRLLDYKGLLKSTVIRSWDQHSVLRIRQKLYNAGGSIETDSADINHAGFGDSKNNSSAGIEPRPLRLDERVDSTATESSEEDEKKEIKAAWRPLSFNAAPDAWSWANNMERSSPSPRPLSSTREAGLSPTEASAGRVNHDAGLRTFSFLSDGANDGSRSPRTLDSLARGTLR